MKDVPPAVIDVGTDGTDIVGCASNRNIESALLILGREKFRRLPITKLGKIEGILTMTDIFTIIEKVGMTQALKETIADWMSTNPKRINLHASVNDAILKMANLGIGSLLLVDEESPELCKGIITERDILYYHDSSIWGDRNIDDLGDDFLAENLFVIDFDTSLEDAIKLMSKHHTRSLIVRNKDSNGYYGMLTANDITHLIAKEREEIHNNSNFLLSITAGFISSGKLISVSGSVNIKDGVDLMRVNRFGSLPITSSSGSIKGMLTERSVLFKLADLIPKNVD